MLEQFDEIFLGERVKFSFFNLVVIFIAKIPWNHCIVNLSIQKFDFTNIFQMSENSVKSSLVCLRFSLISRNIFPVRKRKTRYLFSIWLREINCKLVSRNIFRCKFSRITITLLYWDSGKHFFLGTLWKVSLMIAYLYIKRTILPTKYILTT